jgi:hypothetical protein
MKKTKRSFSVPLVVTVAAWVGPACSETPGDDGTARSGGAASGGFTSGAASGGFASGAASGGLTSGGGASGGEASHGSGGNPPAPCPDVLPEEGTDCYRQFSGCIYPCPDGGSTTTVCAAEGGSAGDGNLPPVTGSGVWTSDGACSAQGGDGGQ